jgi:hypothetical protein
MPAPVQQRLRGDDDAFLLFRRHAGMRTRGSSIAFNCAGVLSLDFELIIVDDASLPRGRLGK